MHSVGDMRRPRSDCPDTQTARMRMLILAMLVSNVIRFSIGEDSYINEQCGQPDLNAA